MRLCSLDFRDLLWCENYSLIATEHEKEITDFVAVEAIDTVYVTCRPLAFVQVKRAFTFSGDLCVTEAAATALAAGSAFSERLAADNRAQRSIFPKVVCQ